MSGSAIGAAAAGSDLSGGSRPGDAPATPALELRGVSKSFPGVRALAGVDLVCRAGTVHALVGENGSGKSTMVKAACGVLAPDEGEVLIGGEQLTGSDPLTARRLGLHAAFQDTALVPDLSVAENVMLSFVGEEGFNGRLDHEEAMTLLEPYQLGLDADAKVATLSPAKRQLLEVARALLHKPRVLLLDEPTATLDARLIEVLERLVKEAREAGVAILYISHRLEEIERLADELTVLRDGEIQGHYEGGGWSVREVVDLMVGRPVDLTFPEKAKETGADVVLRIDAVRGEGFGPVGLEVRPGEIVGIAGAEGNGQRELVRTLAGLGRHQGTIEVAGRSIERLSPTAMLEAGVRFLSGDRVAESLLPEMSVMENSTILVADRLGPLKTILRSRERRRYQEAAAALGIVAAGPDQPVNELSGGNQQKAVMARSILDPAKVLIVDEPTQGVDARSRVDIYQALRRQADEGCGVVVNSSDSLELAGLCDRVLVVSRGVITEELSGEDLTEANIVHGFVATGGRDARQSDEEQQSALRSVSSVIAAPWFPLTAVVALILILGGYTTANSDFFLTEANIAALLALSLPLIVVAAGQQLVLLARGFDISVGAMMGLAVVFASFSMTGESAVSLLPGFLLVLAVGAVVGLVNGVVVRLLNVNPIIATIGMLAVLGGIALMIRPEPDGVISTKLAEILLYEIGWIPISFVIVVVVAIGAQMGLNRTGLGLKLRATGFDEISSRRLGVRVDRVKIIAFVGCSAIAAIAGLYLATQTGVGSARIGDSYALLSLAAAVVGGASLSGGRGSFVGCVVAGLFLSLLVNVSPLLQWNPAMSSLITGALTLIAVFVYSFNRRIAE